MRATPRLFVLLGGLLCLAPGASAAETEEKIEPWETASWSQWRGPDRAGVSSETGLAARWPEAGPAELWRKSLGAGFSGIIVADGRLYTQFASGGDAFVVSLSAKDGSEIWRVRTGASFKSGYGDGPRATPTLEAGVVYA
ncbi:MAG: hypothetical protein V3S47_08895, partial [Acidobacteriota bacterium]